MCATRTISWKESRTIRPTPARMALSISSFELLLPWKAMRSAGMPAERAVASSPPEQTSRLSPSSCSQRTTARERKALPASRASASAPKALRKAAPRPEVGLVEDVGGGAVLFGDRLHVDPPTVTTP
ncbi:hypothetical protein SBADM41S_00062 [Streptomyces badius]